MDVGRRSFKGETLGGTQHQWAGHRLLPPLIPRLGPMLGGRRR